jgi:competence protein ComEA
MFKKLMGAFVALLLTVGLAFGQVDVNKADQAELNSVKGIGPKISKTIVDERTKNGNFKDWADFEKRVKGIGDKNSTKLSEAGLTVNGQPKPGAGPTKAASKSATSSGKPDTKSPSSSGSSAQSEAKGSAKDSTKKSSASTSGASTSPAPSK